MHPCYYGHTKWTKTDNNTINIFVTWHWKYDKSLSLMGMKLGFKKLSFSFIFLMLFKPTVFFHIFKILPTIEHLTVKGYEKTEKLQITSWLCHHNVLGENQHFISSSIHWVNVLPLKYIFTNKWNLHTEC